MDPGEPNLPGLLGVTEATVACAMEPAGAISFPLTAKSFTSWTSSSSPNRERSEVTVVPVRTVIFVPRGMSVAKRLIAVNRIGKHTRQFVMVASSILKVYSVTAFAMNNHCS